MPTADWGYLRLRDEGYSPDDLARWSRTVKDLGQRWRDTYVYFKHEESGIGPALARQFSALIEDRPHVPGVDGPSAGTRPPPAAAARPRSHND